MPALALDVALVHMNRADASGNGQFLGPDPYFDDLFCMAARRRFLSCERLVPTEDLLKEGPVQTLRINRMMTDGVVEAPHGAHFTSCDPDYERDEEFQREYATAAGDPEAWATFRAHVPRAPDRGRLPGGGPGVMTAAATLDEVCVVACAEAWRGDGEILASPIGVVPTIAARLAKATLRARPAAHRRGGLRRGQPAARRPAARAQGDRGLAAVPHGVRRRSGPGGAT